MLRGRGCLEAAKLRCCLIPICLQFGEINVISSHQYFETDRSPNIHSVLHTSRKILIHLLWSLFSGLVFDIVIENMFIVLAVLIDLFI